MQEKPRAAGVKADSDVVSESRLELAGKQACENFISIDGQAAAPKVVLEFGKPRRYPEKLPVGPRRTFRQKALSSAAGEHLSKLEAACTYFLLAASDDRRALSGFTQDGRTKFVESTRVLEISAASVDAAHKRDPRRQMSNEANLSRMQHVRWWLGFGANRLFCQRFKVITQLPTVVLDDNSGLTVRLDLEPASDDTTFLDRVATLAGHQAFGRWESQTLERGCASVPSFLTGTRDVGRALSQGFPPRPGRLREGRREEGREGGEREERREQGGRKDGGAGLSLDCVNPRAILHLADVSRADRARPARRSLPLWAHTVILRPEPFHGPHVWAYSCASRGCV